MVTEISNSVGEKQDISANSVYFSLIISFPFPYQPPSPQGFYLLAIVLLIGYFAENLSPIDTTKAPHLLFPEVVENPKNQSVFIGSNVTFNCTAMGLPTPAISWMKNNDSYAVTSNVRARVVSDNKNNHSQLIITEVKIEDNGKYQCVASNSAGERTSSAAFLYIKELGKTPYIVGNFSLFN